MAILRYRFLTRRSRFNTRATRQLIEQAFNNKASATSQKKTISKERIYGYLLERFPPRGKTNESTGKCKIPVRSYPRDNACIHPERNAPWRLCANTGGTD